MKPEIILLFLVVLLAAAGIAYAASNGFSIPRWTVDSGGGISQGGDYAINGTIGQPDTSPLMSGGNYTVVGGFWDGPAEVPIASSYVYLPVVIKWCCSPFQIEYDNDSRLNHLP